MPHIRLFIEHRHRDDFDDDFLSFGSRFEPSGPSDDQIYSHLAGVNEDREHPCLLPPRGSDADICSEAFMELFMTVVDDDTDDEDLEDNEIRLSDAERWVEDGYASWGDDSPHDYVTKCGCHHVSYLSLDELELSIGEHLHEDGNHEWRAIVAALRSLALDGREVRVFFWFED